MAFHWALKLVEVKWKKKREKKEKAQVLHGSGLLILCGKRPEPCGEIKEEVEPKHWLTQFESQWEKGDILYCLILTNEYFPWLYDSGVRVQVKFCQFLMGPWEVIQCLLIIFQ